MKLEILEQTEHEDGSLTLSMEMDDEMKKIILQAGFNEILRKSIELNVL